MNTCRPTYWILILDYKFGFVHDQVPSTKIYEFNVFWSVWLLWVQRSSIIKHYRQILYFICYQFLCLLCVHGHIIKKTYKHLCWWCKPQMINMQSRWLPVDQLITNPNSAVNINGLRPRFILQNKKRKMNA